MSYGGVSACCVDSEDRVYVLRRSDPPVIVFDRDGKFLNSFGNGHVIEGHGMSISSTDDIWITDKDGHVALRFNTSGEITMKLGNYEFPKLQEPFSHPSDVAVNRNGDIYISDGYGNSRIHHFSPDGELIKRWGKPGLRAQLLNRKTNTLEMDFIIEGDHQSIHVLNAVSPAFTCSFPFADFVCNKIEQLVN